MVVKHTITTMGGIAEAITATAARQLGHGKCRFAARVERLCAEGAFDQELRSELSWLWEARSAIHVHEVKELELDAYEIKDSNRAIKAVGALSEQMRHFVTAREFENLDDE